MFPRVSIRSFHGSNILLRGPWTSREDAEVKKQYDRWGPAWTAIAIKIPSRSPVEVRRRYLRLSGTLASLSKAEEKLVNDEDWEPVNKRLMRIPMETIVRGPFARLAAAVPLVRFRSQRRGEGWTMLEQMALREGYEQYGPRWDHIARQMQYRSGRQCRNFMQRKYITLPE